MTSGSPSSHVTAGFLNTDWNPAISRQAPPPATSLRTADGAATSGSLYLPAGPGPTPWCA